MGRLIGTGGATDEVSLGFRCNGDADAASWVMGKNVNGTDARFGWYYGGSKMSLDTSGNLSPAGSVNAGTTSRTGGYTVATLPAGTVGMHAYVTDALAPTFLATVVGGGTITTPVFYNGSAWVGA